MAENLCQDTIPEGYRGDGSTTKYSFAFQYINVEDIQVYLWDDTTNKYVLCTQVADAAACTGSTTEYYFTSSTPVELYFCVAPELPPTDKPTEFKNVFITRETDICNMVARFFPGTSIRAQDLNNDFTQILLALQEVEGKLQKALTEVIIGIDQLDPVDVITEAEQNAGETPTDDKIFTSLAAATRFDTFVQKNTPLRTDYEEGKTWFQNDTDKTLSIWDGSSWIGVASGGTFLTQPSIIYVDSINGDDANDGHRIISPMRTIKAAVEQANIAVTAVTTNIVAATYNEKTGVAQITTDSNHGLFPGIEVDLGPMTWNCSSGDKTYPEADDNTRYCSKKVSDTVFEIQMEKSSFAHTYVSGGTVTGQSGFLGDGWIIYCAPGTYQEILPITIRARNLSIVGASIRSTFVHPTVATEQNSMFLCDSGTYVSGFTFAGLKCDPADSRGSGSLDPDPTFGLPNSTPFVARFRDGAVIRKSPYIQNCTNFSDSGIDNANFDPNNLPGEGGDLTSTPCGGGILVDGGAVDPNSPLRSFVVDSFTQIALNGPGVLVKTNGYAQLVSFFGTFCWYHAKAMSGGQLNLSNCTTDFGEYGLIADGKSSAPIFSATVDTVLNPGDTIVNCVSYVRDTDWAVPREMVPADHMVVEIDGILYPIVRAIDANQFEIFNPASDDPSLPEAYQNQGVEAEVARGITARFYLQSYISTGGHTFEYTGSGTDYRAHPDFGGVPVQERQTTEIGGEGSVGSRLRYVNGGRVWQSSTDENGFFQVGSTFTINQKTGEIIPAIAAVAATLLVRDPGIDMRGYKIYQDPSTAGANADLALEPSGTGQIVLGTPDFNSDGERVRPSPIMAPILESEPDEFEGISRESLNNGFPVVTQNDVGYDADQIPVSGLLGELAFTDRPNSVAITDSDPIVNELKFSVSGTTLTISFQPPGGGAVQTTTLTLS